MDLLVTVRFCIDQEQKYTFTGGWGGWEEEWRLKLTSAKGEVEVEAELGTRGLRFTRYQIKQL